MQRWVEIAFDCLPLRSVPRLDPPLDASPKLTAKYNRIQSAVEVHGTHNVYYVHNASCRFQLTNEPSTGLIEFEFEGIVFTNDTDDTATKAELQVELLRESCSWLNQQIVDWFKETVNHAVLIEFQKFIAAGDLEKTRERLRKLEQEIDDQEGFVGMYL